MGDREMYEAKARYAQRRFNASAETAAENGMTEGQLDFIAGVCAMRHWFHCNGARALSNEESADNDRAVGIATGEWMEEEDGQAMLEGIGCGALYSPVPGEDIPMHGDWYYTMDDGDREKFREDGEDEHDAYVNFTCHCYARNADTVERINDEIEAWLTAVDEKFGTSFCPTGKARKLI